MQALAQNPAFQQFALRTVNWGHHLQRRIMNAPQALLKQRPRPAEPQQRSRESTTSGTETSEFFHRARAFAEALQEEVSKDLGGVKAPKR